MLRSLTCLSFVLVGCSTSPTPVPLDCKAVFDCANMCGADADGGCTQACVDLATPPARGQIVALGQCDQQQACNGDETCLESRCAAEVAACRGTSTPSDAGTAQDGLPQRYVGTVAQDLHSAGFPITATGQAVFVRDDGSVPSLASARFAVYRLQSLTYVTTESSSASGCTRSANETVTVMNPPALDNHFAIQPQLTNGKHAYDVSVSNHETRAGALTQVCTIGGTTQEDFNADINVSRGTGPLLADDVWNVKATVVFGQTWSWDLRGE